MAKLFDQPIKDAHIILEAADDGTLDVRVSYPLTKLEAPVASLLAKLVAKIPVIKRYETSVPGAVSAVFARLGMKSTAKDITPEPAAPESAAQAAQPAESPAPAEPQPAAQPVAAHEAQPVEPVHQA